MSFGLAGKLGTGGETNRAKPPPILEGGLARERDPQDPT